jgi:CheY-like chemotaxis protein
MRSIQDSIGTGPSGSALLAPDWDRTGIGPSGFRLPTSGGTGVLPPSPNIAHPYEADREVQRPEGPVPPALRLVPRSEAAAHRTGHARHVLIVDSDAHVRDALATFLRQRGFRVWVAANGGEAQAMITYRLPDLLLLDAILPGMSGIDLIRLLRHRRRTHLLPIILISSLSAPREIRNGLEVGADDYITKPADLSVVEARIVALLRRDERLRKALSPFAPIAGQLAATPELN